MLAQPRLGVVRELGIIQIGIAVMIVTLVFIAGWLQP
jgi:hypothetical protein